MNTLPQTPSQTVGPYLHIGLIYGEKQNILTDEHTAGERIRLTGVIYDGNGVPIPDAMVEIWQADAHGIYPNPADPCYMDADPHFSGFGRAETRKGGAYEFHTVKPGGREGHAPFINVHLFARGMLLHAHTRIYFADEPANDTDPVLLSVPEKLRDTLLARREDDGEIPVYRFDIHMQGELETVFFETV
ncbi:MAG TPA: protocatechuate 3,4-dioxygenase subunit alpha [Anaerolineales bacterium]|nr:protocatechuate 3,4-dioxygenase subunit alpha [Anaerolineales bacterium]